MPELTAAGGADRKESRTEKKSRKAIQKLGLKAIPDIDRVTVKQQKKPHFVISKPDVYKSSVSDTYIIFGEAKFDDFAQQAQMAAAESFKARLVVNNSFSLLFFVCTVHAKLYWSLIGG